MIGTSTLYPFELFRLLEVLWGERFSGSIALRAHEETTTLYLVDGQVRYATTTELTGTFPGYLLTEGLFERPEIHQWLERCGEKQRTLEDILLTEAVLDAPSIVAIKADIGASIFARAFSLSASVEVVPNRGESPLFGDLVLSAHDGLFQCVAEGLARPHRLSDLSVYRARGVLERGPTFFRLWPLFRRWFESSPVLPLLGAPGGLADLDPSSREAKQCLTHVFLMREVGMAYFADETPRPGILDQRRAPSAESGPAPPSEPARPKPKPAQPEPSLRREPTRPGVKPVSVPNVSGPLAPPPPANPELRIVPTGGDDADAPWTDPSESFADLRGSLVGADLIDAADRARKQDCYAFLGITPQAPLSEIRAAWQTMRRRYEDERYHGLMLRTAAAKALKELQKRIEAAYDTLTDLRRRIDHDTRFTIEDASSRDVLEDVFYAEGLFKAAQIRLTEEQYLEATQLLDEAFIRNPAEAEYLSYLAFTIFMGREAGVELTSVDEEPQALLSRALAMNPKLESAWLFRARVADQLGQASRAMGAYLTVLDTNAYNDEARLAVRAFKEAGVVPAGRLRRGLAQRLGRLIGGRGGR